MNLSSEPPASRRGTLLRVVQVLPAFVVLAVVAAKPVLFDTPVGTNSMLLVLAGMAYLALCFGLAGRKLLGNLVMAAWALLLTGLVAGGALYYLRERRASRTIDAFEGQWEQFLHGEDWYREYGREFRVSTQMQWHPFVLWRRRPFTGKYINVDSAGLRRTWNREVQGGSAAEVFALGGSVLWGNGARDENTIPSYVSRLLDEKGRRVRVTNYGELAFVSTQNVITLMMELQKGHVPAVVFCFDGVNDVVASYQTRQAGLPQMSTKLSSTMDRIYGDYYRSLTGAAPARTQAPGPPGAIDDALAEQTVAAYLGNVRVIEQLGRAYGFKAVFFWQPVAFVDKSLTGAEMQRVEVQRRGADSFEKVYAAMRAAKVPESFHDLSGIFKTTSGTVYIDFCHITEEGNQLIARRIADELAKALGT